MQILYNFFLQKHLVKANHVPGTVIGARNIEVSRAGKISFKELQFWWRK